MDNLKKVASQTLKYQMQEAIAKEYFEAAASLRDEIKQLEENKGKECEA